jgi:hypothetical protein
VGTTICVTWPRAPHDFFRPEPRAPTWRVPCGWRLSRTTPCHCSCSHETVPPPYARRGGGYAAARARPVALARGWMDRAAPPLARG